MMEQQIRMLLLPIEKDSSDWEDYKRTERVTLNPGYKGLIPKIRDLLVIAHNGNDKLGLWSFDPKEKNIRNLL